MFVSNCYSTILNNILQFYNKMLECSVCCKCYDRRMCGDGDECCNGIGALQEVHDKKL